MTDEEIWQICREVVAFEKENPMSLTQLRIFVDTLRDLYFVKPSHTCNTHLYSIPMFSKKIVLMRKCCNMIVNWCKENLIRATHKTKFDEYLEEEYLKLYYARTK